MLNPGTRLGPYEILAPVGAGGMGEVYRARDTRLDRVVAIKVLPSHIAAAPELRERFEREARAVSSLDHPHICALYDVGEHDATAFLVMQYLDGETLAERLKRGAVPVAQTLEIAIQIADALDKAHRAGIVHRDLKPGNIMLTKGGAKLLDFGLAKISAPSNAASPLSLQPTEQTPLTAQGMILGTLQYMAPEQIEGQEADARTDIFAFGMVLYEMLTGKKAFEGKTQASLFGAILKDQPPPVSLLQPVAPAAIDRVIKTCLAKDPNDRFQSAHDVKLQLEWLDTEPASRPVRSPRHALKAAAVAALVGALVTAAVAYLLLQPSPAPSRPLARFVITRPANVALGGLGVPLVALSPDGTELVYVGVGSEGQFLYLRRLDDVDAVALRGTQGGMGPFFSPDGQWIGFFADGKLKKIPAAGGAVMTLADATPPGGAVWAPDDSIIFAPLAGRSGLWRIPSGGGTPTQITDPQRDGDQSHRWPEAVPGTSTILFAVQRRGEVSFNNAAIAALRLDTGETRVLVQGGSTPKYLAPGHIVFTRAGVLLAVPFDAATAQVTGTPAPVVERVAMQAVNGAGHVAVSAIGSFAYVSAPQTASDRALVWVDRSGKPQAGPVVRNAFEEPRLSPDGDRIAFNITGAAGSDVWVYHISRQTLTRLTFGPNADETPVWSPDGRRIAYASAQQGTTRAILVRAADGSGQEEAIATGEGHLHVQSWSPRGDILAIMDEAGEGGADLYLARPGQNKLEPYMRTAFAERGAAFSPDGNWLAYVTNESGRYEVYAQAFPGPGAKYQISVTGGSEPIWVKGGRELIYRSGDKVLAVAIDATASSLSVGTPQVLFEGRYAVSAPGDPWYAVTANGERLLMMRTDDAALAQDIILVQEWRQALNRLVPVGPAGMRWR